MMNEYEVLREAVRQFLSESIYLAEDQGMLHPSWPKVKELAGKAGLKYECGEWRSIPELILVVE